MRTTWRRNATTVDMVEISTSRTACIALGQCQCQCMLANLHVVTKMSITVRHIVEKANQRSYKVHSTSFVF